MYFEHVYSDEINLFFTVIIIIIINLPCDVLSNPMVYYHVILYESMVSQDNKENIDPCLPPSYLSSSAKIITIGGFMAKNVGRRC